jgi:hypothetical protein
MNDPEYGYSWTAVSRPPYLTALASWPTARSWGGGGVFLSNEELYLNHPGSRSAPHPDHRPQGLVVRDNGDRWCGGGEPILNRRLERHGWQHIQEVNADNPFSRLLRERIASGLSLSDLEWCSRITHASGVHRKHLIGARHVLTMTKLLVGYEAGYSFAVTAENDNTFHLQGASSADWDKAGRLAFVRDGKVFAAEIAESGIVERDLADFSGNKLEAIESPSWAREW